jgi:hypothetical protein
MLQVALEEEVMAFLQRDWHERRPGSSSWRNGSKLRTVKVAGGDGRSPCRKYAEREDRSTLGCFHLTSTGCGRWRRQFPSSTCMTSPPGGCKRPWASSGGSEAWVRRPWCVWPRGWWSHLLLGASGISPGSMWSISSWTGTREKDTHLGGGPCLPGRWSPGGPDRGKPRIHPGLNGPLGGSEASRAV